MLEEPCVAFGAIDTLQEFEKHPDNPFNQVAGTYNMSKEELAALKDGEKARKEGFLTGQ